MLSPRLARALGVLIIACAPALVEVTDFGAVEQVLLQRLVHFVVDVARPRRCGRARRDLRRELREDLAEMLRTLATSSAEGKK